MKLFSAAKTLRSSSLYFLIVIFSTLGCGAIAIYLGKELCWDLANYHFYGPYAFLYHRYSIDYWPSSYIQQFLNPTLDLFSYYLITSFAPILVEFLLGFLHGINIVLLFMIARIFLKNRILLPLSLACLGLYGPTTLAGIGSFQQDNLISLFVLLFVYLQLCLWDFRPLNFWQTKTLCIFILSCFLLGIGTGLKLTCGIYFVGAVVTWFFLLRPFKICGFAIALAGFSFGLGILLSSGHWMAYLWITYGNPVFPFLNHIFKSPDFALHNWQDLRFMPKTIMQTLFYPFFFSWDGRTADIPFQDVRFLLVYILCVASLIKKLMKRFRLDPRFRGDDCGHEDDYRHGDNCRREDDCGRIRTDNPSMSADLQWLLCFFIFSYFIWQWYFSIARYLAALEMLAPLLIYLLIENLIKPGTKRLILSFVSFYALILLMIPPTLIRAPWYDDSFFNVSLPTLVHAHKEATVLTAFPAYTMDLDPRPQSYLAPFFPRSWQFVGVPFFHGKYLQETPSHHKIHETILAAKGPIYLLTADESMPELYRTAALFGLKAKGNCEEILSDRQAITNQAVWLCPVA